MKQSGIIIGGGIGGLTTAIALNQLGIKATVYERADVLQEVGAGLVLSPNALFVLDRLGLTNALNQIGWPFSNGLITDSNGRVVMELNMLSFAKRYGYGSLVVQRGKLQKMLLDALQPEQVQTGKQLKSLADHGEQIRAQFTDGTSAEGRFMIGADGIRSTVRQHLFGAKPLRYSGQTCWRTLVDFALPQPEQTTSVEYWGRSSGLRIGIVPCGLDQLYVYITQAVSANGHDKPGDILAHLLALSHGFPPTVQQIIGSIQADRIHRADLYDLPTLTTWQHDRCTLLGDAAHATTPNIGQGACQTIEDAYVIAASIAQNESIPSAFRQYELARKAKADRVVKLSRQIGQLVNLPGWLKPLAFMAMKALPKFINERQFDGVYNMDYARNLTSTVSQSRPAPAGSR